MRLLLLWDLVGLAGSLDCFRDTGAVARSRGAVRSDEELSREDEDRRRRRPLFVDLEDEDATEPRDDPVDRRRDSWSKASMVSTREALDSDTRES